MNEFKEEITKEYELILLYEHLLEELTQVAEDKIVLIEEISEIYEAMEAIRTRLSQLYEELPDD